jgi:hypothetical protein
MLRYLSINQDEELGKVDPIHATCGEVQNNIHEVQANNF